MGAQEMPGLIRPMLATLGPTPAGEGWGWEWKWDGVRAVAYLDGRGGMRLLSRNDRDMVPSYPDLAALAEVDTPMVVDGEIVAFDATGAPNFSLLQNRMHVQAPSARLIATVPVRYLAFDAMWLSGRDLTDQPYTRRREVLESLPLPGEVATVPPWISDGEVELPDLLEAAARNGLEGVIAKRLSSRYQPGRRSSEWVKVPLARTQEAVIVGWKPGERGRAGAIGSLLLAAYDDRGELVYIGHVGTGFTQAALRDLKARLDALSRPGPPLPGPVPREHARDARWVEPRLVGEVQFRTWTPDRRLRHPSWRGLRPDREAREALLPS